MVAVGQRDRLVTIQRRVEATSDSGFPIDTWPSLATVFMEKRDASIRERFIAEQLSAPGDHHWTLPYRHDMDPELVDVPKDRRLSFKSRIYDITGAKHLGLNEGIVLTTIVKAA